MIEWIIAIYIVGAIVLMVLGGMGYTMDEPFFSILAAVLWPVLAALFIVVSPFAFGEWQAERRKLFRR